MNILNQWFFINLIDLRYFPSFSQYVLVYLILILARIFLCWFNKLMILLNKSLSSVGIENFSTALLSGFYIVVQGQKTQSLFPVGFLLQNPVFQPCHIITFSPNVWILSRNFANLINVSCWNSFFYCRHIFHLCVVFFWLWKQPVALQWQQNWLWLTGR